jgi:DNA-binding transcriptional ArsR family regulator
MDYEEDTYTTIFRALKHPIRRKILHMLDASPLTYSEILNKLGVETGFLNYHLDSLNTLIKKDENKYLLSEIGRASMHLTTNLENKVDKESRSFVFYGKKYQVKQIFVPLILMLLVLSGSSYLQIRSIEAEQAQNLQYEISLCGASMNVVHEKIDRTLNNNFVDLGDLGSIVKETERISVRIDAIMFLDKANSKEWMQAKTSIISVNNLANGLQGYLRAYNLSKMEISAVQNRILADFREDLKDFTDAAFPVNNATGSNELGKSNLSNLIEASSILAESAEYTQRAFNLGILFEAN